MNMYYNYMMNQPMRDGLEMRSFFDDIAEEKREYTLMFKGMDEKDRAKAVVVEHVGRLSDAHQEYCYYTISYMATKKQDAEICRELVSLGLLDENEI